MELIITLVVLLVLGVIWWRIWEKTGRHGALGLLNLIPIVNVGVLLFLAFTKWPIEDELDRLRRGAGRD